jgi:hypothetical protein
MWARRQLCILHFAFCIKAAPGPRHFNKEQTPLGDLLRSQPAVSRRLFRCLGAHLLRSPLNVKSSADTLACFLATAGQNPLVENLGSPTPQTVAACISRCRLTQCHSATPFVIGFTLASHSWAIKNPASDLVSRVESPECLFASPAYHESIWIGVMFTKPKR